MAENDDLDEDLFADLYENEDGTSKPSEPQPSQPAPETGPPVPQPDVPTQSIENVPPEPINGSTGAATKNEQDYDDEIRAYGENIYGEDSGTNGGQNRNYEQNQDQFKQDQYDNKPYVNEHGFSGTVGIKEDGKMFIGGLNWETTDQSLRDYFSQFGEVLECTVMRDGATGRSRGFGFLTFKDPRTVNIVMVKEHYLDGKIIDPKRAIPRDEQERTSKIFVGGVSQDATERDFENYFAQFGRVVDATLMMDKDTGRPRGFGFVTFEGEAAVDACLAHPLEILGKPIEVKRAQPRGGGRDEEESRGGKFGRRGNERFDRNRDNGPNDNQQFNQAQAQAPQGGPGNGLSPQMMAQYWQRMQQYFSMMQSQMSQQNMGQGQGMGGNMQMPANMNSAMMQQMMAMQGGGNGGMNGGNAGGMNRGQTGSPFQQNQSPSNMQGMTPQAMQQQMEQMQQMQQQQGQGQGGGNPSFDRTMSPSNGEQPPNAHRPGFSAQEQQAFEQRKYEQQAIGGRGGSRGGSQGPAASWDGMYDGVPQPGMGPQGGRNKGQTRQQFTPQPAQPSQAPANAPTGPKNAGKPGANFRGGRGGQRGFHPYARH